MDNGLMQFLYGGEVACTGDTWHLTAEGNGQSAYFLDGLDAVSFQAWDLRTGTHGRDILGSVSDFFITDYGYRVVQDWAADVTDPTVLPCSAAPYLAFTITSLDNGALLKPVGLRDPDSTVRVRSGSTAPTWSLTMEAPTSDEAWVWMTYPHLGEAWGPFAAVQEKDGDWFWELDPTVEAWMTPEEAVFAVIGCAGGQPVGTSSVDLG